MQWACYKKASVYGSRVGWTPARRIRYEDPSILDRSVIYQALYNLRGSRYCIMSESNVVCCWQGFGVAAKSTSECRHVDPMTIVVFHQADIGEYIRSEAVLTWHTHTHSIQSLYDQRLQGSHSFGRKKNPVFQSSSGIFQVLSVVVRYRISSTFGPQ